MAEEIEEPETLDRLTRGTRARVLGIAGEASTGQRLVELGVIPGVEIKFVRAAPFGDPLEYEVMGYRLSLRKSEAATIQVEAL
ncbi:MAG: FeoA family protein [Planctomycetota bacterium]|jgi:Fe2+ transport system protein FeoA|nr:FeoA family protein [Planctomycetota bacterium]